MVTEIHPKSAKRRHRSIYLFPNLLTVGALFAGFYAIVAASQHRFEHAAIAIFLAILIDGLDGRIARMTHSVSDFGAQFDSLSDMLCFGVTPALVLYSWSLSSLGKLGWLIAFVYTTATALRLARFNTQLEKADKRYFQGLATPVAAGLVASIIWVAVQYHIDGHHIDVLMALVTVLLALLKVSTVRYRSFKDLDLRGRVPFMVIPIIALSFALISFSPAEVLLILFMGYVLSGPIMVFWRQRGVKINSFSTHHLKTAWSQRKKSQRVKGGRASRHSNPVADNEPSTAHPLKIVPSPMKAQVSGEKEK